MKVTRTENQIKVESAYNPSLPNPAKKLGGKWNPAEKVWVFDLRDENRVAELYRNIYGEFPADGVTAPAETVTIRVTVDDGSWGWEETRGGLFLFGRQVAYASGRDSGARLGGGVVVISGKGFGSGGSVKNWRTICEPNTVFEIRDIPKAALNNDSLPSKLTYEVVGEATNRDALVAEKEALLARLVEIDKLLGN